MSDSIMDDSDFGEGASSDFAPPAKAAKVTKPKAAPKKAAAPAKPKGRPAGAAAKPKAKAAPKKKVVNDENSDIDMDEDALDDDESLLADTPPKQKKAPAPKKTSGKPLADIENESFGMEEVTGKKAAGGASSKYQMVSASSGVGEYRC
jgi:DNA topoisomerase-2